MTEPNRCARPHYGAIIWAWVALACGPATAIAQDQRGAGGGSVQFASVRYEGSGCPSQSVVQSDGVDPAAGGILTHTVGFIFSKYGLNISMSSAAPPRMTCRITVTVRGKAGVQFALDSATFKGRVMIEDGVSAVLYSAYGFDGVGQPVRQSHSERTMWPRRQQLRTLR